MGITFDKPDTAVTQSLASVMEKYHPALHGLGVTVGVLMCFAEDGPAVKHSGYPALAKIKVMSLKDRIKWGYDAELLIDKREWDDLTAEQRLALLDHELSHLRPILKKSEGDTEPKPQYDDIGRPRLRTVLADIAPSDGFRDVVARHGENAIEFHNLRRAHAQAMAALNGEIT